MAKNNSSARKYSPSSIGAVDKDDASSFNLLKAAAKKLDHENNKPSNSLLKNTESNKKEQSKHSSVRISVPEAHKKHYEDDTVAKSTPSSPRSEKCKKELYKVYKLKQPNTKILVDEKCQSAPVSPRSSVKIKHKNPFDEFSVNKKLGDSIETKKDERSNSKSEINILKKQLEITNFKLEKAETTCKDEIGMLRLTVNDLNKARIEHELMIYKLVKMFDELIYVQQTLLEQIGELIENQETSLKKAVQSLELAKILRNQMLPPSTDEEKLDSNRIGTLFTENDESSNYGHEQVHIATTNGNYEEVNST